MDSARVRDASNGQAFFNGTVVPFVRLPVPGDRIALPQVVEVVGVRHTWVAAGAPVADVFVRPVTSAANDPFSSVEARHASPV